MAKNIAKRLGVRYFRGLPALLLVLAIAGGQGCARKSAPLFDEEQAVTAPTAAPRDSSAQKPATIITELDGKRYKKAMPYPYLTVRYRKNDTDVEMVLDPLSTNLTLDLKRDGNSRFEVLKGDSSLTGAKRDSLHLFDKPNRKSPMDDLTDEIVRDINLAQELFYQKQYEQALKVLNASLRKKQTAAAYALGGSIYFVNGDLDAAVRAWENALSIDPGLENVQKLVARFKNSN